MNRKEFKISDVERVILSSIDSCFKYLARDESGCLYVHEQTPFKIEEEWVSHHKVGNLNVFMDLFDYIRQEDEKPTLISDLLSS